MSSLLRSKQGCWTCRLRKKKCDESLPICTTCESLSITCHGFGPKPDWMDGGYKERAVAESMKEIVKHTSRRKGASQLRERSKIVNIAPRPLDASREISPSDGNSNQLQNSASISLSDEGLMQEIVDPAFPNESASPQSPSSDETSTEVKYEFCLTLDDSSLLMHFLDTVYPLEHPMYDPDVQSGGRGWLLMILLRTPPLYHAALALSAYHRRIIDKVMSTKGCQVSSVIQQTKHLEICMKAVNQLTKNGCPGNGLGIITSVIHLMFYELCTSDYESWQTHLHAAVNLYCQGNKENLAHFNLDERTRRVLCEDLVLSEKDHAIINDVVSFRLISSTIIWLDIIYSISTGITSQMLPLHAKIIGNGCQTSLEDIMGCKNWVMLQISRITQLQGYKIEAVRVGNYDCSEFHRTANDISREIEAGFTDGILKLPNSMGRGSNPSLDSMESRRELVTYLFSSMAILYLHLVSHGFQNLGILDAIISKAVGVIQVQVPEHVLPAVVAPLFLIGCVARPVDERFFRVVFSTPSLLNPLFRHRTKILPALEQIWSRRQSMPNLGWSDVLDLIHNILLI